MSKIAVIGDRDSVCAFASIGLEVFSINEPKEASKLLKKLSHDGYAVIYITETLASEIQTEIDKYRESVIPAIILIPSVQGSTGEGMKNISRCVLRAVGSDIT